MYPKQQQEILLGYCKRRPICDNKNVEQMLAAGECDLRQVELGDLCIRQSF